MKPFTHISVLVLFGLLPYIHGQPQDLVYQVNPGCDDNCNATLVHISSRNPNGTYHYLWSFVDGFAPAIFSFHTDKAATLKIEWPLTDSKSSLSFVNGATYNAFAMEISKLYFINSTDEKSTVPIYSIPLRQIKWAHNDSSVSNSVAFLFESTKESPVNGTISLALSVFNQAGRSDSIPRLQYTEASNLFEVTLDNIFFKIKDNKTAQAQLVCDLTFVLEGSDVSTNLHESVSIDDEYTPGVFQRYTYGLTSKKKSTNESAYAEWKPVAYYDSAKVIAKSIKVTSPSQKKEDLKKDSILNAYFIDKKFQATGLNNFKFGIPDDDFDYQTNRFLQFSLAFGLNQVPEETLSMTLKIIIVVGLGLPMVLFLISIVYTVFRKLTAASNGFSSLNEDTTN